MPLVLIHEDHKVPTVHPDTGTGTTETGNGGAERRNDPVGVRIADGVDSGLKVGECRRRVHQGEWDGQQDPTNHQRNSLFHLSPPHPSLWGVFPHSPRVFTPGIPSKHI